jgi:hypothetical protein
MGLRKRPSPTELPLGFTIDPEPIPETLTSWGGAPLLLQAFRSLGLPRSVSQHVHIKQRDRGYDEASMVESFVVLHALGGDCLDDFARLREEAGLREMLGGPWGGPGGPGQPDLRSHFLAHGALCHCKPLCESRASRGLHFGA